MKITVWVATNRVGSRVERECEVPDDELEELPNDSMREDLIADCAKDVMLEMIEWGWRE
jgi:hypothetical protein